MDSYTYSTRIHLVDALGIVFGFVEWLTFTSDLRPSSFEEEETRQGRWSSNNSEPGTERENTWCTHRNVTKFNKMATMNEKAHCVEWYMEAKSPSQVQRNFRRVYGRNEAPSRRDIK
ncbi:hypothetical protein PR048_001840 [Dryococelus australis]|uniref:DUF4817 domain-containing protein n=1 Tax=Dryococelus australis TaxID=614101 RepID=A0ABQ9IJJ8_9NEOP|nr:hypothetical protein PR048_001840 [Dryococelus australis]